MHHGLETTKDDKKIISTRPRLSSPPTILLYFFFLNSFLFSLYTAVHGAPSRCNIFFQLEGQTGSRGSSGMESDVSRKILKKLRGKIYQEYEQDKK